MSFKTTAEIEAIKQKHEQEIERTENIKQEAEQELIKLQQEYDKLLSSDIDNTTERDKILDKIDKQKIKVERRAQELEYIKNLDIKSNIDPAEVAKDWNVYVKQYEEEHINKHVEELEEIKEQYFSKLAEFENSMQELSAEKKHLVNSMKKLGYGFREFEMPYRLRTAKITSEVEKGLLNRTDLHKVVNAVHDYY